MAEVEKCKFPKNTRATAYSNGCRCEDCLSYRRKARRSSMGRPFEERQPSAQKRYPVPVGPIIRVMDQWLEEDAKNKRWADEKQRARATEVIPVSPMESLGIEIGMSKEAVVRMIYRFRNGETTYIAFKTADNIVSSLYGPHYWYTDPELLEIYEEHA